MRNFTLNRFLNSFFLRALLGAILFIVIVVAICMILLKSRNKSAQKFKNENPDAVTIWIAHRKNYGVKITKVDGNKAESFQKGITDGSGGAYILPGEHVLTVEHVHSDPKVNKEPEYKKQKITTMRVSLERGKDYSLLFNHKPGEYSLIEGKEST